MKAKILMLTAAIALSALGGCSQVKKLVGGKPSGQVVATVNGEEITSLELRQELGGFSSRDPKIVKAAQQQALQQIIMRRLLAQNAKADKLDKSSTYVLQVRRGEEALLAQTYQQKLAAAAATPTRKDAETYISENPGRFGQRRILVVNQIIAPIGKLTPDQFKPLKTLDDVKSLLQQTGTPFQENVSSVDTLNADPRLVAQIDKLAAGDVFIVPQNGALIFNTIASTRSAPFTGDPAIAMALNNLRNQGAQDVVRKKVDQIRKDAESKIVYSAGFKPAPAPKPAAAAAPSPAPSAAAAAAPAAK